MIFGVYINGQVVGFISLSIKIVLEIHMVDQIDSGEIVHLHSVNYFKYTKEEQEQMGNINNAFENNRISEEEQDRQMAELQRTAQALSSNFDRPGPLSEQIPQSSKGHLKFSCKL